MLNFEDFLLIQMKNRMKILAYRTVIRISFHNICHEIPPFTVYLCICTLTPFFFIFYFYISKQCECFFIQKNGIIFSAIFMYHIFHFRPEQIMTSLVFLWLPSGKSLHQSLQKARRMYALKLPQGMAQQPSSQTTRCKVKAPGHARVSRGLDARLSTDI